MAAGDAWHHFLSGSGIERDRASGLTHSIDARSGYAWMMDSRRFGHTDDSTWLEAFILGGDTGYPAALTFMSQLDMNATVHGIRGPVVVVGVGTVEMMPYTDEASLCRDIAVSDVSLPELGRVLRGHYRELGIVE